MKRFEERDVSENPLYHDTWKLLKKYRDVVWSLEISVQHVRAKFEIEYGTSIEDFLDSIYLAGADLAGSDIEHHAKCIERSHKMLKLLDSAVDLLRTKHKNGEALYWLLYYSFLSPQQLKNVEEIIENLRPHIRDISFRTYYRKRREAIDALSSVLWGYTSKGSLEVLEQFFPEVKEKKSKQGRELAQDWTEIGAALPLSRKSPYVKLNMLKLAPKTEYRQKTAPFGKALFCCLDNLWPGKEPSSARRMRAPFLPL